VLIWERERRVRVFEEAVGHHLGPIQMWDDLAYVIEVKQGTSLRFTLPTPPPSPRQVPTSSATIPLRLGALGAAGAGAGMTGTTGVTGTM